jgi:hypothetical protein
MRITITKGERADELEALRADGSRVTTSFPHKGPVPHDAVHFHVESTLEMGNAFWGMVAGGRHPDEVAAVAKAGGHASASRAAVPDEAIIQLVQAERAVECFEADLWSGSGTSPQTIRDTVAAGCAQSLVPALEITDEAINNIRLSLTDLAKRWSSAAPGERLVLEWVGA